MNRYKTAAFTIVELLVSIAVIAILVTVTMVGYGAITQDAREKSLLSDLGSVVSEVTRYGIANDGQYDDTIEWYSGGGQVNSHISFTPTEGNVIDVVAQGTVYCVRAFNPDVSGRETIETAVSQGSNDQACQTMSASLGAGGTGGKLVGWWKLNGNALDASGKQHHGTVSGALATQGQNGQASTGYHFDGVNDYIELPGDGLTSYGAFTLSAWARAVSGPSAAGGYGYILHRGIDNYIGTSVYWLGTNTVPAYAYTINGNNTSSYSTTPSNTATWHNLTVVYNGSQVTLYVDGVQEYSYSVAAITNTTTGNRIGIGSSPTNPTYRPITGDIDDVRVYDYALNPAEITALHSAGAQ